ncbi:DUF1284 domain-containing protein [Chloroflexota bacterium]
MLQLRAHHICCLRFSNAEHKERDSAFGQVQNKIKSVLLSQPETAVVVVEGVDELCHQCINCVDECCISPKGDEVAVRKWDAILLKELGLPFGTCLTSGEWQALIEQKTPFKLCQRCLWKPTCSVGINLL